MNYIVCTYEGLKKLNEGFSSVAECEKWATENGWDSVGHDVNEEGDLEVFVVKADTIIFEIEGFAVIRDCEGVFRLFKDGSQVKRGSKKSLIALAEKLAVS